MLKGGEKERKNEGSSRVLFFSKHRRRGRKTERFYLLFVGNTSHRIASHRIAFVSSPPTTATVKSIVLRHSLPDAMTAILGIPSKRLHVVHVLCAVSSPKKRNAQNRKGVDDSTEYVRGAGRNHRNRISHISIEKGCCFGRR